MTRQEWHALADKAADLASVILADRSESQNARRLAEMARDLTDGEQYPSDAGDAMGGAR